MSAESFTQGPWIIDPEALPGGYRITTKGRKQGHAWATQRDPRPTSPDSGVSWEEALANARLMTAALDLYEVLQSAPDIMSMQPEELYTTYTAWLKKAKSAVAKARGETA